MLLIFIFPNQVGTVFQDSSVQKFSFHRTDGEKAGRKKILVLLPVDSKD